MNCHNQAISVAGEAENLSSMHLLLIRAWYFLDPNGDSITVDLIVLYPHSIWLPNCQVNVQWDVTILIQCLSRVNSQHGAKSGIPRSYVFSINPIIPQLIHTVTSNPHYQPINLTPHGIIPTTYLTNDRNIQVLHITKLDFFILTNSVRGHAQFIPKHHKFPTKIFSRSTRTTNNLLLVMYFTFSTVTVFQIASLCASLTFLLRARTRQYSAWWTKWFTKMDCGIRFMMILRNKGSQRNHIINMQTLTGIQPVYCSAHFMWNISRVFKHFRRWSTIVFTIVPKKLNKQFPMSSGSLHLVL